MAVRPGNWTVSFTRTGSRAGNGFQDVPDRSTFAIKEMEHETCRWRSLSLRYLPFPRAFLLVSGSELCFREGQRDELPPGGTEDPLRRHVAGEAPVMR